MLSWLGKSPHMGIRMISATYRDLAELCSAFSHHRIWSKEIAVSHCKQKKPPNKSNQSTELIFI